MASEYLLTSKVGLRAELRDGVWIAVYQITIEIIEDLPTGAFLEARFEDPGSPDKPLITGKTVEPDATVIQFFSPEFTQLECRNHRLDIHVFEDATKTNELGIHTQWIDGSIAAPFVNPNACARN